MADTTAIAFVESVYQRTDGQIRAILAAQPGVAEVDTINVILGDGVNVITPGIAAAIRVDFLCRITGIFFQEFDGTPGSIRIDVQESPGGAFASWARISPPTRPGITDGTYSADDELVGWSTTRLERGTYLRFVIFSAALMMRCHVALRIRRLEP